MGETRDNMLD